VAEEHPFFSVIIPTHNRNEQLRACLQALAAQTYPRGRFEVLVVDDGSLDPPREIVASFHDSLDITLLVEPHGGPSAARNAGAGRARGEFLAFTDDDCAPAADWLQNMSVNLARSPGTLIGGRTINALTENIYSATSQALIDIINAHYNRDAVNAQFLASNNIAMAAAQFHAMGAFDVKFLFAEDREFCARWLRHGYRMIYAPDVLIYHYHCLSPRKLWRQHFNYGRGAFDFHRVNGRDGSKFQFDPAFYFSIFRFPLTGNRGGHKLFMEVLMFEIQMANAAGFFFQALKSGRLHKSAGVEK
jgi:glycosyltransferase involved in cell wall biosynthesis